MKQKLIILILLVLSAVILIGLNAASYTQKEKVADSEFAPNRSTFNPGSTGLQAFFTLLNETGRRPVHWREAPAALITAGERSPGVFVVAGEIRRRFTEAETVDLLRWVSTGRRLVVIDRNPSEELVTTTAHWRVSVSDVESTDLLTVDASDQKQMVGQTPAVKPVQPSVYTRNVNAIQPSRFAGSVSFTRFEDQKRSDPPVRGLTKVPPPQVAGTPPPEVRFDRKIDERTDHLPGAPAIDVPLTGAVVESPSVFAPVVHFGSQSSNLVVHVPYGEGEIVYVADPFMVSNAGIDLVDNAQLAINLVSTTGTVAFDEYHQGFGIDSNRFLQFFSGTPVIVIFLQGIAIVGLVFFSRSRRFARPVPEAEADRLSKLEYVAAMSDLQHRTKAYDLAIENIFSEFRRRVTRVLGMDNLMTKTEDLAARLSERTGLDRGHVAEILYRCEDIIRGGPTNKKETLRLTSEIREIERKLGLARSGRRSR